MRRLLGRLSAQGKDSGSVVQTWLEDSVEKLKKTGKAKGIRRPKLYLALWFCGFCKIGQFIISLCKDLTKEYQKDDGSAQKIFFLD